MKAFFGFVFGILLCCLTWSCQDQREAEFTEIDHKNAPSDFLNIRYNYPNGSPDLKAMAQAKSQVKQFKNLQKSIPGANTQWRLEGPGNLGGRINTIAPHPTSADTLLIGFSNGGIYKTVDAGQNWYPVFDDAEYSSVSAIVYNPNNPQELYAGTGDHNLTGLPFTGDGVHKSIDGGETWTQVGLAETGVISRIVIDPVNPNNIYVAAMGFPFAPDSNRGLYKSDNGGASWNQVLFLGDSTGVIDVVMHPTNPNILLAAGWDRIRSSSTSVITGQGAKIYRSADGGNNWSLITNGLPQTDQCRIGITPNPSNPNRFYAEYIGTDFQVEGIYQTDDAGLSWQKKNGTGLENISGGFGWYFGQIRSTQFSDQVLYHCSIDLWRSLDGGDTWGRFTNNSTMSNQHADTHDLRIDADNNLWLATDGGLYKMLAGTSTWVDMENIPTNQFYRVAVDPFAPGTYYGGMQDNGTAFGDSAVINNWTRFFGGDGFSVVFHPTNTNVFYVETQNGNIYKTENNGLSILYFSNGLAGQTKPWDMYYFLSPSDPDLVYTGAQEVFAYDQTNGATQFESISPNLTESDTASNATRFHIITHLSESSINLGLLYVGTSDGLVWRRPANGSWELITTGLPDRYVTRVIPSELDGDRVFLTHSGYRDGENAPLIHVSNNQGNSWTNISGDLPAVGINELIIYPNSNDSILFVGTDFGVYASLDQGSTWDMLDNGFPSIPVYDMDLDTVNNRLVASTYGRSIFTLDLEPIINPSQATVLGEVMAMNGNPVENVTVKIATDSVTTDIDGLYSLNYTPQPNCVLDLGKTGPNNNGVTVLDIVQLQRHVILLDTLPLLAQVAGDVNGSNDLTVTDAILIQRSILLIDTIFAKGVWTFVPESFVFTDNYNAFVNPIPGNLSCSDAGANGDFWALKVGDVSGNANLQFSDNASNRSFLPLSILTNEEKEQQLVFNNQNGISGFQFKLNGINKNDLLTTDFIEGMYVNGMPDGLSVIWTSSTGKDKQLDAPILQFKPEVEITLATDFRNLAVGNVSGDNGETWDLKISKGVLNTPTKNFNFFPNPVQESVTITVQNEGQVSWELFNQNGVLVFKGKSLEVEKFEISNLGDLPKGMYFLKVAQGAYSAVEKLVLVP